MEPTPTSASGTKTFGARHRVLLVAWWCVVTLTCIATLVSAYGGMVNPDVTTIPALMSLVFPAFLMLLVVVGVVSCWVSRWALVACVGTFLICGSSILDYAPVNFKHKMPSAQLLRDSAFTMMSYNVYTFAKFDQNYGEDTVNPTISYILKKNPDVACLMECYSIKPHYYKLITQSQADSLNRQYPYHYINAKDGNSIFSKYPLDSVAVDVQKPLKGAVAVYRSEIHGKEFTFFVVHMASLRLNPDDRKLYKELTKFDGLSDVGNVRTQLVDKLSAAFRRRAKQARQLRDLIDTYGRGNVIVTGDFNDIQGCYALRTVMGDDFKSVYADCACGPAISYYGNRFFFRIDHILYHGDIQPLWIDIDKVKLSDHYPLLTQFLITNK